MNIFLTKVKSNFCFEHGLSRTNVLRKRKFEDGDFERSSVVKAITNNGRIFKADLGGNVYEEKQGYFYESMPLVSRSILSEDMNNEIHALISDDVNNRLYVLGKGPQLKIFSLGEDGKRKPQEIARLNHRRYFYGDRGLRHFVLIYPDPIDDNILYGIMNDGATMKMQLVNMISRWTDSFKFVIEDLNPITSKTQIQRGIEIMSGAENKRENNILKCIEIPFFTDLKIIKAIKSLYGPILMLKHSRQIITLILMNEIGYLNRRDFVFLTSIEITTEGEVDDIQEIIDENILMRNPFLIKNTKLEVKTNLGNLEVKISSPWKLIVDHFNEDGFNVFFEVYKKFFGIALTVECLIKGRKENGDSDNYIIKALLSRSIYDMPRLKDGGNIKAAKDPNKKNQIKRHIKFSSVLSGIENHYKGLIRIFINKKVIKKDLSKTSAYELTINKKMIQAIKAKMASFHELIKFYVVHYHDYYILMNNNQTNANYKDLNELELTVIKGIQENAHKWVELLAVIEYAAKDMSKAFYNLREDELDGLLNMNYDEIMDENEKHRLKKWICHIMEHESYSTFDFKLATSFPSYIPKLDIYKYQGKAALSESLKYKKSDDQYKNLQKIGKQLIQYSEQLFDLN